VHGPHDASFYKLLAELEEEYYDLKRKGYSGEGFHSDGNRLQGLRLNEYEGRKKGLAAAEKRLQQQRVMGRGGVLGGSKVAGKTMREIVAEAAERRQKDDKTCKVDTKEAEEEARKAQEESVVVDATEEDAVEQPEAGPSRKRSLREAEAEAQTEVGTADAPIVIDDDVPDEAPRPARTRPTWVTESSAGSTASSRTISAASTPPTSRPPSAPRDSKSATAGAPRPGPSNSSKAATGLPTGPSRSIKPSISTPGSGGRPSDATSSTGISDSATKPKAPAKPPTTWTCGVCTLINPVAARQCEACENLRPVQKTSDADGWWCEFCGAGPREMGFWSCLECGWVRKWG
jgi:hypothetical protein